MSKLIQLFEIDDPLDAFAIQGGCGYLGVVISGIFHRKEGIFYGIKIINYIIKFNVVINQLNIYLLYLLVIFVFFKKKNIKQVEVLNYLELKSMEVAA